VNGTGAFHARQGRNPEKTEMQTEPQITFRHVEPNAAIEKKLLDEIDRLERLEDRLIACRIMVELPDRRHRKGNLYHVRIDLVMPGEEIVVDRHPPKHSADEDALIAIGEAFDAARKRLVQTKARRQPQDVRHREEPPRGRVSRLVPEEDYGFIEAADGREIYFHRNAVASGGFDRLEIGTPVTFAEEDGEKGPQATIVHP
jgi:cold shock CspA family protein/ribosome-associated translation inhibitor RaiA